MTSAEPEQHGCEEAPAATAAAAAAAGSQMIRDDVKMQGTVSSTLNTGSTSGMTATGLQSTKTMSSAGCDKKAVHKAPKPGKCFCFFAECVHDLNVTFVVFLGVIHQLHNIWHCKSLDVVITRLHTTVLSGCIQN